VKAVIYVIGIIVLVIISYFLYFDERTKSNDPVSVEYVEVTAGPFVSSISTTGRIISRKVEIVKSTMNGIILDSGYHNREYVAKGTVIARIKLEQPEYQKKQQQLKLAEIDIEIIREQRQQAEELFQAKAISERELKEFKIREYKQKVHVNDIKEELADKSTEASFNGMIVNKKFNHLDRVFNGTELFTLIDAHDICVELPIFQQDITKVHVGQNVIFTSNTFTGPRNGKITEISSLSIQLGNQNYNQNTSAIFYVYSTINALPQDQILFGSNIDAEIVLEEKENALSVPLEAILYRENEKIVFVVENGKARKKMIETGEYNENFIEIISGVSKGEKVITRGNLDVENGVEVVIGNTLPNK